MDRLPFFIAIFGFAILGFRLDRLSRWVALLEQSGAARAGTTSPDAQS